MPKKYLLKSLAIPCTDLPAQWVKGAWAGGGVTIQLPDSAKIVGVTLSPYIRDPAELWIVYAEPLG